MAESHDSTPLALYDETVFDDPQIFHGERLELHAERSRITKQDVEGQRAIVTRRVVVQRKTFEIDVLHEELHVDYLPAADAKWLAMSRSRLSFAYTPKTLKSSNMSALSKRPCSASGGS